MAENVAVVEPVESDAIGPSVKALLLEEVALSSDRRGVVILEPGSFNLRFGFAEAEDRRPASIVNCIAYRCDSPLSEWHPTSPSPIPYDDGPVKHYQEPVETNETSMDVVEPSVDAGTETEEWQLALAQLEFDYSHPAMELQRVSKNSSVRFITPENCSQAIEENAEEPTEWANLSNLPEHIVGDQALYLDDDDGYDVYFPIQNGRFNFTHAHMTDSGYRRFPVTLTQVTDSLERIWRHVVFEKLEIGKKNDVALYDVLLVIPDSFVASEVQHMIDILLLKIGFGHVLIQKSSPCAALGAGRAETVIVNIGFSMTTVSCVGTSMDIVPGSSFSTLMGGLDVSRFLKTQLEKNADAHFYRYKDANIDSSVQDLIIFEEMKESCCHLNPTLIQPKLYEFVVRHRNFAKSPQLYRISVGMPQFFAPMVLCSPQLDKVRRIKYHNAQLRRQDQNERAQNEVGDIWADLLRRTSKPSKTAQAAGQSSLPADQGAGHDDNNAMGEKAAQPGSSAQDLAEQDQLLKKLGENGRLKLVTPDAITKHDDVDLSIPHLIVASVNAAAPTAYLQARYYSQIVLVGGSSQFNNLTQLIEQELQALLPPHLLGNVSAVLPPAGISTTDCVWNGASLLVSHTPREFWLDRVAWRTHGLLALREKLLFPWDSPASSQY